MFFTFSVRRLVWKGDSSGNHQRNDERGADGEAESRTHSFQILIYNTETKIYFNHQCGYTELQSVLSNFQLVPSFSNKVVKFTTQPRRIIDFVIFQPGKFAHVSCSEDSRRYKVIPAHLPIQSNHFSRFEPLTFVRSHGQYGLDISGELVAQEKKGLWWTSRIVSVWESDRERGTIADLICWHCYR